MTRPRPHVPACVVLIVILGATFPNSQEPTPQRAPGTVSEGVTAVLADVVVRDRRGQIVGDLSREDFEVFEDGVRQTIGAFTRVVDGEPSSPAALPPQASGGTTGGVGSPAPVNSGPGVTALVFHGLSPEGRRLALQATQNYLGSQEEMANYVGVFGIDLSLRPLVPFTRNGVAVRRALAAIGSGSSPGFDAQEFQQQKASADREAAAAGATPAAPQASGGPSAQPGGGPAYLAVMQSRMIESFTQLERDQQGYVATDALMAIVSTMGRLPGRKSVVLFSEGIAIPAAVHRLFLGVIDAANRANVSIYTIDAAGLRTESDQARIRDRVNQTASVGINTAHSDSGGGALIRSLEDNEHNLRSDPAMGLGRLAQETGGVLFNNTNNLRPAFERIDSDLRNYYLLGYTPANPAFDGRFRTIDVRVKRPGLTVAARKGYFAVRNPGMVPINSWEAPALGALELKPVPNAFPVRAGALLFPERGRPGLVPVVVEFATAPLTFQTAPDGKTYTSDFSVLVRFLDGDNQVVRKVSQHYEIQGELAQMERAKQGTVLFYRESELPPGVYSMETVVHDALSAKASVRFTTVEVPRYEEGKLRMSSVVLVKRGEEVPEKDRRPDNPLLVNGLVLQPNIGEPVSRAAKEVAFYFSVYPGEGGPEPRAEIQLLQNGQSVARLPMPVGTPDGAGRIQQIGSLPVAGLVPGSYELRALVAQGQDQVSRSTMLRIGE